jgi:hypothetical protein
MAFEALIKVIKLNASQRGCTFNLNRGVEAQLHIRTGIISRAAAGGWRK